jgi:hypothetical protein
MLLAALLRCAEMTGTYGALNFLIPNNSVIAPVQRLAH